ncbi:outer membrane protein OmpK [Vibrio olivae]|uniref:Outer membrane protein OmpK n=1 Tax=Vibrio olivae TaxID=1243002 RepID=A0ABV5HLQ5_9VIBR
MKSKQVTTTLLIGLCTAATATTANAEMIWQDFSVSYLNGSDYEVGDKDRQVITFEHASGHSWGDTFFFLDRLKWDDGTTENYSEFSPRASLSHLSGSSLSFGPVKDVLISTTWESGEGFDNFLYGVGFALDVPGFNYFNLNFYQADNDESDDDQQLTWTWGLPVEIGGAEFLWDGFLDWSSASDTNSAEMNWTSQVKWNAGKLLGLSSPLYLGIEYSFWNNKFGIKDADERNAALLVKWHF